MTKIVNSWNDFDPPKHVIVGLADHSVIPPEEPATSEKVPIDSPMRGMWGPRPVATVEAANEQPNNYVKILEGLGIKVDRPTPLQWNQHIQTPDFRNDSMFTQMPPRDILLTIGNEIMASANSFRCRYFEYLAYWDLMNQYFEEDPEFKWTQAPRPRPTDKSYKHNYYDEKISLHARGHSSGAFDRVVRGQHVDRARGRVVRHGPRLFLRRAAWSCTRGSCSTCGAHLGDDGDWNWLGHHVVHLCRGLLPFRFAERPTDKALHCERSGSVHSCGVAWSPRSKPGHHRTTHRGELRQPRHSGSDACGSWSDRDEYSQHLHVLGGNTGA